MIRLVVTTTSRQHRPTPVATPDSTAVGTRGTATTHPASATEATERHWTGQH
ncbi:hypothetical protein [Natronolimnobius baerhuensis]|uniref:hypothetical protein n=1 Tax=Natronolimnobius baerhuensis TaxID=253108 RepID=UPI001595511E|nr:hypothetical protein [Natronolimnobius baerhuensis]